MRSLSGTGFWEGCLKEIVTKLGPFPRRNHTDKDTEAETSSWGGGDEQQLGVTLVKETERGQEWLKMQMQRSTEEGTKEGDVSPGERW